MAHDREQAERVHDTLQSLCSRLKAQRIYFRRPTKAHQRLQSDIPTPTVAITDRDRVICGLAAKAAQTHQAIGALATANLPSDAMALARVMMENVFSLSWILQDVELRADLYYLSPSLSRRRLAEMVVQHYTHRPKFVEQAKAFLANKQIESLSERLSGTWDKWARRDADGKLIPIGARGIFLDLGNTLPDGTKTSFAYDVMYFTHSHHVHSTMDSLDTIFKEATFTLSPPNSDALTLVALNSANVFLIQALADIEKYVGYECFQPELDEIWQEMKGQLDEVFNAGF
jgi:hypothetical protein